MFSSNQCENWAKTKRFSENLWRKKAQSNNRSIFTFYEIFFLFFNEFVMTATMESTQVIHSGGTILCF